MLNLRKKTIKNLQTNLYSTFYYLYIKHKYILNCALYQKPFFFINYLILFQNFNFIFKFKTLINSKNLSKLYLQFLIIKSLYFLLKFTSLKPKFFFKYRIQLLKNFEKFFSRISIDNIAINQKNLFIFNKRWNLL